MKLTSRNKLFLSLCVISLAYTLPAYNKYWAPYDEGIIIVAAERLLAGELPYKDFFLIMYPPGQIYVLGALLKIFSFSLTAGRIYTVLVSAGISVLVFYMTYMLTYRRAVSLLSWLVVLISLAPRLGAIPAPIWPGVFLSLLAIYVYMLYLKDERIFYIILSGLTAALAILFRHDIGIFAVLAILGSIFFKFLSDKKAIRKLTLFVLSALIVVFPCALYFIKKGAGQDMIESLILFPFIHQKTAGLPFPLPCLNPAMIFHGSLHFITVNQYYIPVLVYLAAVFYLKEYRAALPILLFGIFTFNQVMMRTDPAHLLTVIQPSAILFGCITSGALSQKFRLKISVVSRYAVAALIFLLFFLLSVKGADKYIKNNFRKVYKRDIIKVDFDRASVYIPKEEKDEVASTVEFIKKNTGPLERIYIGNIAHWKDDFNGSVILYFLAERLPSAKYYELAPGLGTNPAVQEEIRDSLQKYGVRLLVLQDIELGNMKETDAPKEKRILDDFIKENYRFSEKFGKYNIYLRNDK